MKMKTFAYSVVSEALLDLLPQDVQLDVTNGAKKNTFEFMNLVVNALLSQNAATANFIERVENQIVLNELREVLATCGAMEAQLTEATKDSILSFLKFHAELSASSKLDIFHAPNSLANNIALKIIFCLLKLEYLKPVFNYLYPESLSPQTIQAATTSQTAKELYTLLNNDPVKILLAKRPKNNVPIQEQLRTAELNIHKAKAALASSPLVISSEEKAIQTKSIFAKSNKLFTDCHDLISFLIVCPPENRSHDWHLLVQNIDKEVLSRLLTGGADLDTVIDADSMYYQNDKLRNKAMFFCYGYLKMQQRLPQGEHTGFFGYFPVSVGDMLGVPKLENKKLFYIAFMQFALDDNYDLNDWPKFFDKYQPKIEDFAKSEDELKQLQSDPKMAEEAIKAAKNLIPAAITDWGGKAKKLLEKMSWVADPRFSNNKDKSEVAAVRSPSLKRAAENIV